MARNLATRLKGQLDDYEIDEVEGQECPNGVGENVFCNIETSEHNKFRQAFENPRKDTTMFKPSFRRLTSTSISPHCLSNI